MSNCSIRVLGLVTLAFLAITPEAKADGSRSDYKAALLAAINDMDICMTDINALLDKDLADDSIVEDANFEKVYLSSEICLDGFQTAVQLNVPIVGKDDFVATKMMALQPKVVDTLGRIAEVTKLNLRADSRFRE